MKKRMLLVITILSLSCASQLSLERKLYKNVKKYQIQVLDLN